MNRLQKKCLLVSAGTHLLLLVILMVGPAFLARHNRAEEIQEIDFIPSKLVDANVTGGGDRNARPPAAQQATPPAPQPQRAAPAPAPAPEPVPEKAPPAKKTEPEIEPVKEPEQKTDPFAVEPSRKKPPVVSLAKKTRKNGPASKTGSSSDPETAARSRELQRLGKAFETAASGMGSASSTTAIVGEYGPGGGGPAYAGYAAFVKKVYTDAWIPPEEAVNENGIVKARVVISRDGSVKDAEIISASGDAALDSSVRRTLESVRFVEPFPEGATDSERKYTISFNLKAKRGLA